MHFLRNNGQVVGMHHVFSSGKQSLAKLATGVEMSEVVWPEVAHLHQRNGQRIAHNKCRCGG